MQARLGQDLVGRALGDDASGQQEQVIGGRGVGQAVGAGHDRVARLSLLVHHLDDPLL